MESHDVTDLIHLAPQNDGSLRIEPRGQAQDSLTDQMRRVHYLAHQHGQWDAADWIARAYWGENTSPGQVPNA